MRLNQLSVTAQEVAFRLELEGVDLVAEAGDFDCERDFAQRQRLAVQRRPGPIFRRHVGLENGELDGEGAVVQHHTAMRAFDGFGCGGFVPTSGFRGGIGGGFSTVAGGKAEQQAQRKKFVHGGSHGVGVVPGTAPVRRSISVA